MSPVNIDVFKEDIFPLVELSQYISKLEETGLTSKTLSGGF